jgi:ATP-dependent exoDNAse (exonuclease V) beta subunit
LVNTQTGNLIIIDYKTNEDLFKNFMNRKMLGKFSYMLDNNFNKYQIQLAYYKILLEQTGYKVSTTKIIWLKDDATYAIYDTNDLTKYLM